MTSTEPQPTINLTVDENKLNDFAGKMVGAFTGAAVVSGVLLGDELGLYRTMSGQGQLTAEDVAQRAGCHPRLVREWLDGQAAYGLVEYDARLDRYALSPEGSAVLADETSPAFMARGANAFKAMYLAIDGLTEAYRGDGGFSWGRHDHSLFRGTEWFFRTGYRTFLATTWIPALDGVEAKLRAGAQVADVGCGHGASVVVMAQAYPASRIHGFDFHPPSVEVARSRAEEAGVSDRCVFDVADGKSYGGSYDLICFFDCLHDMGDPVGIARHARSRLAPGGSVMLVEPFAVDGRSENMAGNPFAALFYNASSAICTPNSLSQEVGRALGAQSGEAGMRSVFEEAGFASFRRATETPFNIIYQATT